MLDEMARPYWKSIEEREAEPGFLESVGREFAEPVAADPAAPNRRDFLALAGFALGGLVVAGCNRPPPRPALPFVIQPEEIVPGRSLHYASTCQACGSGCGMLVKCRDGRPIKLEGNPEHPLSRGGLCAVGQASILGLYDRLRLQRPLKNGRESTWQEVDGDIRTQLNEIRASDGAVRVLSGTILSPTTRQQVLRFLDRFADGRHIVHDPLSSSAILAAHERTHGARLLPHYRLERAEVIVAFDADFLGTWISPVEFARAYQEGRTLTGNPPRCSWHVQFEGRLSLTGAKADERIRMLPGELGLILTHLASRLARHAGVAWDTTGAEDCPVPGSILERVAERLWNARGRSLVLCGSQDLNHQLLCNFVNHLLGNYGGPIDVDRPSLQRQGNDAEVERLVRELKDGHVAALFVLDSNPAYTLPEQQDLAAALRQLPLLVCCAERLDETAALARYVCPHPHALASWNDAEPIRGLFSLAQPTFAPLGNTRTTLESLANWSGESKSARQLIQEFWRAAIFPNQTSERTFQQFWDQTVHDGVSEAPGLTQTPPPFAAENFRPVLRSERPGAGRFTLLLHPNVGLLDGRHAYNPWLQELPDPITKVAWDNYVCLSPATAERLNIRDGDVVRIDAAGTVIEPPALLQPGQHDDVLAVPLGYGSKLSERFASIGPEWLEARPTLNANGQVGTNAASLLVLVGNTLQYHRPSVTLARTGGTWPLASTQTHHSIDVPALLAPAGEARRPMLRETTVADLQRPQGREHEAPEANLWPNDHPVTGPRWGMVIDLSACNGCSACVVACQVENNIPVVGKDEVRRQREMHWLRIDRYYAEADRTPGDVDVAFQPMLCQHCGNAPCETVCPVLATVHSSEGLNQQVYNRCVGTRYCANNCPYKVRRFNWFAYAHEDALQNLVLNPDVTVRSRGVMEKCSFCVQRIQETKLEARRLGLPMADGAVQTACQQSCPAKALHFGNLNDPSSDVARLARSGRSYQVLAELNVQPAVHYLKVVRNRPVGEE